MCFLAIYCCFQIGDLLMCYILRHSSIFLPVKKSTFFQVSGLPLNVLLQKSISTSTMGKNRRPQSTKQRCPLVRNYWFVWHSFSFAIHAWWFGHVFNTKIIIVQPCTFNMAVPRIWTRNDQLKKFLELELCQIGPVFMYYSLRPKEIGGIKFNRRQIWLQDTVLCCISFMSISYSWLCLLGCHYFWILTLPMHVVSLSTV